MSALLHCVVYVLAGIGFLCVACSAVVVLLLAGAGREDGQRQFSTRNLSDEELAEVLGRWAGSAGEQP